MHYMLRVHHLNVILGIVLFLITFELYIHIHVFYYEYKNPIYILNNMVYNLFYMKHR
jgi:hypothetical protein